MVAMSDDLLALFHRAATVADTTVSAIRRDQFDDPTPCTQWTVRTLINHLTTGNLRFVSLATGTPPPDRTIDHLGDDHAVAFRDSLIRLREVFDEPGFLDRSVQTPFGPGTGAVLVEMRFNECMVHSWDLARATGQSTDLDPDLAALSLASFQRSPFLTRARAEGGPFGAEQPAPEQASVADRLAAFVGRTVQPHRTV
jgi:uncharacterized protein (TIGR03086 family)